MEPSDPRFLADTWHGQAELLLNQGDRTADQDLSMLALAQGAYCAWQAVAGRTAADEAREARLVSRVHAVTGEGRLAEAWARRSLGAAEAPGGEPRDRAGAREALARAFQVQGRPAEAQREAARARKALGILVLGSGDPLEIDLAGLEAGLRVSPGAGSSR